jgi:glycosyltransferase involved in cell wall biosynthesis
VAERLVRRGHAVTVVTSNSNLDRDLDVPLAQPVPVEGVTVWYFGREEPLRRWLPFVSYLSRSMGFLYSREMRATLERLVPTADAVHTHLPFVYPTLAAARSAFRHGKPLIYHQRGVLDPERLRFRGIKKRAYIAAVERPTMRCATTLVALTDAEVASYRALGVETPVRVIPNGVDAACYRTTPSGAGGVARSIPATAPVVLFFGRIHPTKGADRLLRAFLEMRHAHPEALLVMAGPDEWALERRFRDSAAAAGAADRVLFPGMMTGDEKLDLLARADLFALPSDAEGFSLAVLEALASATPVLLSPGCHFPEVETAGAGRVVASDPAALADALRQLLSDRATLAAMGRRGRSLVEDRYSWDRITDATEDAYREAIARRRIGGAAR